MNKLVNVHKLFVLFIALFFQTENIKAQEQKEFATINEILVFTKSKNYQSENG